jgi:hypothetical protein
MFKFSKTIILLTGIFCFYFIAQPALGISQVLTNVKVIHASTNSKQVDPGLTKIISELKSVFKYTSYKLLKDKQLNQHFNEEGIVNLPGKRTLVIIPTNMDGKRISYQINIKKNNRSIFQTRVSLKNNKSVTIGGPQYKKGVLLFNISGSAD